jgi:hypothetical protein
MISEKSPRLVGLEKIATSLGVVALLTANIMITQTVSHNPWHDLH